MTVSDIIARFLLAVFLLQCILAFRWWMWPLGSRVLPPHGVKVSFWKGSPGLAAVPVLGWIEILADYDCRVKAEWNGRVILDKTEDSSYSYHDLSQMTAHVEGNPPESGKLTIFEPFEGNMDDFITENYSPGHYLTRRPKQ